MQKEATMIRLEPELKQKLTELAEMDGRSLSSLIGKIAADWMKAQDERRVVTADMAERIRVAQTKGKRP